MSYRTITVNEQTYEYVVGRSHTKIKHFGVFENRLIGEKVQKDCGIKLTEDKYTVSPFHVANAIKGIKVERPVYRCVHGFETHKLTEDPYTAEIHQEVAYIVDCPKCIDQSYGDI